MLGVWNGLPPGYRQIEWLKSDGNQYVNTGVTFNQGIKITAVMGWHTEFAGSLVGARADTGSTRFLIAYYSSKVDFGYGGDKLRAYDVVLGNTYAFVMDTTESTKLGTSIDGDTQDYNSVTDINTGTTGYIFADHRASDGSVQRKSKSIFKSLVIENALGVKLFDGVPCVRIADSEPGIYDFAGKQFLTNLGTGNFTIPT